MVVCHCLPSPVIENNEVTSGNILHIDSIPSGKTFIYILRIEGVQEQNL